MFQQIFSMICTPRSITAARSKVTECCLANKLTVGISYPPVFEQTCGNERWTLIRLKSESKVPQNLESSSCWRQWQRPRVWRHCQTHRLVLTTNSEAFFSSESCVAWFPSPGSKSFRHSAAMTFPAIHGNSENGISHGIFLSPRFCHNVFFSSLLPHPGPLPQGNSQRLRNPKRQGPQRHALLKTANLAKGLYWNYNLDNIYNVYYIHMMYDVR